MFKHGNVGKCSSETTRKHIFDFLVALFAVLPSVGKYLVEEPTHLKVFDVAIDVLNDRQSAFVQKAQNINQTFEIVFSSSSLQVYHCFRGKKTVAIKVTHTFLFSVLAVVVE